MTLLASASMMHHFLSNLRWCQTVEYTHRYYSSAYLETLWCILRRLHRGTFATLMIVTKGETDMCKMNGQTLIGCTRIRETRTSLTAIVIVGVVDKYKWTRVRHKRNFPRVHTRTSQLRRFAKLDAPRCPC
jgi:hypothetical protein